MVAKPNQAIILKMYSLDELLSLIQEKARMNVQEQMNLAREQLNFLIRSMNQVFVSSGDEPKEPVRRAKRGRPSLKDSSPDESNGKRRGRKRTPLGQMIQEVLTDQPMKVDEIIQALQAHGYKSKSKDPRRILYLELKKQVEKGAVKKTDRGMYARI